MKSESRSFPLFEDKVRTLLGETRDCDKKLGTVRNRPYRRLTRFEKSIR
jgi:hypothetical protein